MVVELLVSFLLSKTQMDMNGVTSHQILKFSYYRDPKTPVFARLQNVFDHSFSEALENVLQSNEIEVIRIRNFVVYYESQWVIKVFPSVDAEVDSEKLILLSAQDEAYSLLLNIIKTLRCEVVQELPDLRVRCLDFPSDWTIKVKRDERIFIIEIQKAYNDRYEPGVTCTTLVGGELKKILFCLQNWEDSSFRFRRFHNTSLDPVRKTETFACDSLNYTSFEVLSLLITRIELFSMLTDLSRLKKSERMS